MFEVLESRDLLAASVSPADLQAQNGNAAAAAAPSVPGFNQLAIDIQHSDPTRILVRFRDGVQPQGLANQILPGSRLGAPLSVGPELYEVLLPTGEGVAHALAAFRGQQTVQFAEPDYAIQLATTPNDPLYGSQWGLQQIDAPDAWSVTTGSASTVVAVIDTGVDYNHPDLASNIWVNTGEIPGNGIDDDHNGYVDDVHGWDFVNNDNNPMDDNGHGTHVAGTIAAVGNNGIGVAGVAWNVKIMPLKVFDASGHGYLSNAAQALRYAVLNGATVSNNSYISSGYSSALESAISDARAAGHIFVAAAGNSGANLDTSPQYPAAYTLDNMLTVAATDTTDTLAAFSNYGATSVDLAAPGVNIYSTLPGDSYGTKSGTSMAAPFVTGAVALVRSLHPDWTYTQVINDILSNVDPVPNLVGKTVSGGRLNVANALGPRLQLQSSDPSVWENGGTTTVTLTRSGDLSSALTVALANSDTTDLSIPSSVTIAAGQRSTTFEATGIDNTIQDGTRDATITATATGYFGSSLGVSILDNEAPPLALGLVNEWKFDATSGTLATDSAGSDNGTLLGTAAFISDDQRGQVLSLSGSSDRVALPTAVNLGSQWTISAWFEGLGTGQWKTLTRGLADHQIIVDQNGELGSFDNAHGTWFHDSGFNMGSLSAGWHNVVAVGSGGTTTFYVDGAAVGSIAFQAQTNIVSLGNYQGGDQRFADRIDDLRLYARALSATDIAQLANVGPQAPTAVGDTYQTLSAQPLSVSQPGVLANDSDANGDTLTAVLVSGPNNAASFALNADGSFQYTPAAGFAGTDSFTYEASDGTLLSAPATVTITVSTTDPNLVDQWKFDETTGTLAADSVGGDNGTLQGTASFVSDAMRGQVLSLSGSNDRVALPTPVNLGSQWTISAWFEGLGTGQWKTLTRGLQDHQILVDQNGELGSFDNAGGTHFHDSGFNMSSLSAGWHNVAAVGSGGTTTFYVDGAAVGSIAFQAQTNIVSLGNYQNGSQRFADRIDDLRLYNSALIATEIAQLAYVAPQAPYAANDSYWTSTDQSLSVSQPGVLANDSDANGDSITAVLVSGPSNAASFALNADGSFQYTPTAGFTGVDSFTYEASDGTLLSAPATVTITVNSTDPSLVAHWKFDETSGTLASNSTGGDNGTLEGAAAFVSDPQRGQVLALSGPNDRVALSTPVNLGSQWTISAWFEGLGTTQWKTLTRGLEDHQILVDSKGELGSYDNSGGTRFHDSGFNMNSLTPGWHNVAAVGSDGKTTFYVDGVAVGSIAIQTQTDIVSLGNYQNGGQRFADRIDDLRLYNRALSAADIAQLAYVGPQAPYVTNDNYWTSPDQPLNVSQPGVLANDWDANGDGITAVLVSGPSNAASFALNADGSFQYTPAAGFSGVDSFTYEASDGSLLSTRATVTITVSNSDPSLVHEWKFDETTGTLAADSAGADDGTLQGTAAFVSDPQQGQVLALNGANDRVALATPINLGGQWTISAWFEGLATGQWKTLTRGLQDHQIIVNSNGELGSYDNAGGTQFHDSGFNMKSLSAGWHNIAAVGSDGVTTFYIDGAAVGSIAFQTQTDIISLGNYQNGGQEFADRIDDLRLYNRALSAAEIAQLAAGGGQAAAQSTTLSAMSPTQAIWDATGGNVGASTSSDSSTANQNPVLSQQIVTILPSSDSQPVQRDLSFKDWQASPTPNADLETALDEFAADVAQSWTDDTLK